MASRVIADTGSDIDKHVLVFIREQVGYGLTNSLCCSEEVKFIKLCFVSRFPESEILSNHHCNDKQKNEYFYRSMISVYMSVASYSCAFVCVHVKASSRPEQYRR